MSLIEFIDENIFVIDSENLAEVKSRLYGYMITPRTFYGNCAWNEEKTQQTDYPGIYTLILEDEKIITIKSDPLSSRRLFLYRETA